jgi:hypothetical protein
MVTTRSANQTQMFHGSTLTPHTSHSSHSHRKINIECIVLQKLTEANDLAYRKTQKPI